jgi:hypothetical protein
MIDEPVKSDPSLKRPRRRFRFSLKMLLIVTTLVAAGAAVAANYPDIAALVLLVAPLEFGAPRAWRAFAKYLGRSRFRLPVIAISLGIATSCLIWILVYGLSSAVFGVVFGYLIAWAAWATRRTP